MALEEQQTTTETQSVETTAPAAPQQTTETSNTENVQAEIDRIWDNYESSQEENSEPQRDEHGRFARADAEDAETEDGEAGEHAEPTQQQIAKPHGWGSRVSDEAWAKMPDEAKQFVMQREHQMRNYVNQAANFKKHAAPLMDVVQQNMDAIQARGIAPEQALSKLFDVHRGLTTDPYGTVAMIAENAGVDLAQLVASMDGRLDDPYGLPPDPEVERLKAEHQRLAETIERDRQERAAERQQALIAQQHQSVTTNVERWAADKPHFDAVADHMQMLIRGGLRQQYPQASAKEILDIAYESAVRMNPQLQASETLAADTETAERAKNASRINVRSATKPSRQKYDDRKAMDEIWSKMMDN